MTPPRDVVTTRVTPPAEITALPPVFGRDGEVVFSASFEAPKVDALNSPGIHVRVYNQDELNGEPLPSTEYLAEGGSDYDLGVSPGTRVQVNFESVKIPRDAGDKLYVAVWCLWTVFTPVPNPEDPTKVINFTATAGNALGSATFSFQAGTGGKREARAGYLKQ